MLDAAEGVGVVARKGAWYSYGDTRLGQGREKTLVMLEDDTALSECVPACHHPVLEYPARHIFMQWLECTQHLHNLVNSLPCAFADSLHGNANFSAYQHSKSAAYSLNRPSILTHHQGASRDIPQLNPCLRTHPLHESINLIDCRHCNKITHGPGRSRRRRERS